MFKDIIEIVNMAQLEILGVDQQLLYIIMFCLVIIVLSLIIHIIIYLLVKYRLLFVLYYIISISGLLILQGHFSIGVMRQLSVVTTFNIIALYGYCFTLYLLIRSFILKKI